MFGVVTAHADGTAGVSPAAVFAAVVHLRVQVIPARSI